MVRFSILKDVTLLSNENARIRFSTVRLVTLLFKVKSTVAIMKVLNPLLLMLALSEQQLVP